MNREDIIRIAREARMPYFYQTKEIANLDGLERFANLIRAYEPVEESLDNMEREALRLALETLENPNLGLVPHNGEWRSRQSIAITAIKEALAQPKQEPQRPWVGLTEEEVDQFHNWKDCTWSTNELVRYVEATLKSKNT